MGEVVIHTEELGKRYRLGARVRNRSLREAISDSFRAPHKLLRRPLAERFWALKDVSLEVRRGDVLGLIGRNGAGKTTLLKILSRITRPTTGTAEIHGRVSSLLEVGTGFHPELTGRENIYLSGAILGMGKKEIVRKFDEIVAFAEIEQFLDTAVKHYSSGMFVRLAFAVAAHLEPDILLVDEVLSVGDLAFQKKCLGKMDDASRGGRTVLFVSHQMNQMRRLCSRVVWFDGGQIRRMGPMAEVVGAYEAAMSAGDISESTGRGMGKAKARFVRWEIAGLSAGQGNVMDSHGPLAVRFLLEINEPVANATHGIALYNNERQLLWGTAVNHLRLHPGVHQLAHDLPGLPLRPGVYWWRVTLLDGEELLDGWDCVPEFLVATEPVTHWRDEWAGVLNIPSRFSASLVAEEVRS